MLLLPTVRDYRSWCKSVPDAGDLIFSVSGRERWLDQFDAPVYSEAEIRAQSLHLWRLQDRSWYGYALNSAKYGLWLPPGRLEAANSKTIHEIAIAQNSLRVPTVLQRKNLPRGVSLLRSGQFGWITAQSWLRATVRQRISMIRSWYLQNEVETYQVPSLSELPKAVRLLLKEKGVDRLINTFANISGPNCFAATNAWIGGPAFANQWLHWGPLQKYLRESGYEKGVKRNPSPGDVLVFMRNDEVIHSAVYLGEGLYFEKPGQDFYEPYRVVKFSGWRNDWPKCKLQICSLQ